MPANERRQGKYWLLTIPQQDYTPYLPQGIQYIKGKKDN